MDSQDVVNKPDRPNQGMLADNLARIDEPGMTLRRAFTEAGYSQNVANGGWQHVPNKVVKLLAKKGIRLKELGKIDAETQEQIVRGRLVYNVIKGSDKGVMSAKALGSDRRVNMFVPDSQTGVIVLNCPQGVETMSAEQKTQLLQAPEE
jgi:hypothetical protein